MSPGLSLIFVLVVFNDHWLSRCMVLILLPSPESSPKYCDFALPFGEDSAIRWQVGNGRGSVRSLAQTGGPHKKKVENGGFLCETVKDRHRTSPVRVSGSLRSHWHPANRSGTRL